MRKAWKVFLVISTLCIRYAVARTNYFISPPAYGEDRNYTGDHTFTLGDTINIAWKTDYTVISPALFQQSDSPQGIAVFQSQEPLESFKWTISLADNQPLSQGGVFYLQMYNGDVFDDVLSFNSHYFNIVERDGPATTHSVFVVSMTPTGSVTITITPELAFTSSGTSSVMVTQTAATAIAVATTSLSSASTTTGTKSQTANKSSNPHSSSGGLSSGAKAGLGVGIGIGVACLSGGVALSILFRRRSGKHRSRAVDTRDAPPPQYTSLHVKRLPVEPMIYRQELSGDDGVQELQTPAQEHAQELPGHEM